MQTFLPYPDLRKSIQCLDYRRLGKQRVEARQILYTNVAGKGNWYNHPAVCMWRGYNEALKLYMNCCIVEWIRRGYNNTMEMMTVGKLTMPPWLGSPDFHASHRSNLLCKDPGWYGQFGWTEPKNLLYVWYT